MYPVTLPTRGSKMKKESPPISVSLLPYSFGWSWTSSVRPYREWASSLGAARYSVKKKVVLPRTDVGCDARTAPHWFSGAFPTLGVLDGPPARACAASDGKPKRRRETIDA